MQGVKRFHLITSIFEKSLCLFMSRKFYKKFSSFSKLFSQNLNKKVIL